jgi:hypothetical protein
MDGTGTKVVDESLPDTHDRLITLLREAKRLATEYRRLTGRPLGITGEIAEYEAARLLGVELTGVRQAGYDAIRTTPTGLKQRLQIKGRCLLAGANPGQKIGRIDQGKEWDAVVLVLLAHFGDREQLDRGS